jgi:hypothetical protein
LSPEQLGQLACIGTKIPSGNIVFASFPAELFKQARQHDPVFGKNVFVLDVDFNTLRSYVSLFNNGAWPNQTTMASQGTEEEAGTFCP